MEYSQYYMEFNIVEVMLISMISFIGAFGHEFMLFLNQNKRITLAVWGEIGVTTLTVSVISLSINPFLVNIHPRLILLPPLLMGLLGEELLNKLIHIDKSSKLIVTILKILKIKIPDDVELPEAENSNSKNPQRHIELLKEMVDTRLLIEETILQYNQTHNVVHFLEMYKKISPNMAIIKLKLKDDPDVEDVVISEYKELTDSFRDMNHLWSIIVSNKKATLASESIEIPTDNIRAP